MTVTDLSLDKAAFAPSFDSQGNSQDKVTGALRNSLGTLSSWTWDGRNSQGAIVQPGVYTIQLSSSLQGLAPKTIQRMVQVLPGADEGDAVPKLVYLSLEKFQVAYQGSVVRGSLRARVFNLAGEQVAVNTGSGGKLFLDLSGKAAGIYIVSVEYTTVSGTPRRSLIKAAVLR